MTVKQAKELLSQLPDDLTLGFPLKKDNGTWVIAPVDKIEQPKSFVRLMASSDKREFNHSFTDKVIIIR